VLSYAVQTGRRTDNPIRDTQGAFDAPTREHFASIGLKGLPAFLKTLEGYQGHANTIGIIRMILWTGSRTGEVRGATPDEFDLDIGVWRIPAERMKKRRMHVVPLPRQAVALLRELMTLNAESRYMFPSPMHQSMASENIVLQAIKKMGYGGQTTGHGLRAAVSTGLEEMGYPIEIIKTQLSHAKDNLTDAAYLRGVHLERRAEMMQVWADNLDALVSGAKVLPLKRKTAAG
jgi:integrase